MSTPPIREAATIVLLRDACDGLEVFMVRRARSMAFSAGAYVFPGGAIDPADAEPAIGARCMAAADAELDRRLQTTGARRFLVAALRETFEETAYLLARDGAGSLVACDDAAQWEQARARLRADAGGFASWLEARDLWLDGSALHYYAYWTTPPGESRRFATRFFAAAAPQSQAPCHDGQETVAQCWIRPQVALQRFRDGAFKLIFPTIKQLEFFQGFGSVAEALAAIDAQPDIAHMRPRLRITPQGRFAGVALPGDPGYEELPAWD